MRILLPPSETKKKGGEPHLGPFTLSFPVQDLARRELMIPLEKLCRDNQDEAARVLKLGPKSVGELANNVFTSAPVMPAIDRYRGVLFSATNASNWTLDQRRWAGNHVFIHSALWGIVSSMDQIPNYRLSHDTRLDGHPLASFWGNQLSMAVTDMAADDWVLDARSSGYRELAPIPDNIPSYYLEVVSKNGGKALNHFNKIHKGELVAALVADSPALDIAHDFVDWAGQHGLSVTLVGNQARLAV